MCTLLNNALLEIQLSHEIMIEAKFGTTDIHSLMLDFRVTI